MSQDETAYISDVMTSVAGWFSPEEGLAFHRAGRSVTGRGVIVEIGSWQGKSTICLAKGSLAGSRAEIHAIDPHIGSEEHQLKGAVWTFDQFQSNIARFGVSEIVRPIVKMSWDAAKDFSLPIEFLFIDGAHDYDSVKKDVADWFPKLLPGGWVAFHDSDWPGVTRTLGEDIYKSQQTRAIHRVKGTTFAQKVEQNTFWDRLLNRLKWARYSWGLRWRDARRSLRAQLLPKRNPTL